METTQLDTEPRGAEKVSLTGNMTSPRLGVVRSSMLKNPLLIKAPLRKARSRGLFVPGPDFTFGTRSLVQDGGVAEAISNWRVQSSPEDPAGHPDFVSLNRNAVRSGLVTSKEFAQYRAQRAGALVQNQASPRCGGGASRCPKVVPDVTFGVTNRPSSPMADVLSHQYTHRWINEQLSRNQSSDRKKVKPDHVAETRTSLLRRSRPLPVVQSSFNLPQFTQVAPALDSFRNPEARQRALGARRSDSVVRRGHRDRTQ